MYERILVPIDGGVTAAQGLKEAIKIAQYHGSLIHLVHIVDELPVIEPFGGTGGSEFVMAQLRDIGKSLLDSCTAEVRDCGIPVEGELIEQIGSRAADLILRAAVESRADLIVCGTHGRTGVRRVVLGSTVGGDRPSQQFAGTSRAPGCRYWPVDALAKWQFPRSPKM